MAGPAAVAHAQDPTRFDDPVPDGCAADDCSLREALLASTGTATITLAPGTYQLTQGELQLGGSRQLLGAGARRTTISAGNNSRVVAVTGGSPTIRGVTIVDGLTGGSGGGINVAGGASLWLENSTVRGNQAAIGGGVASAGGLTMFRSTIEGNRAGDHGGGLAITDGLAAATYSTLSGNHSEESGGGIYTQGDLELTHVTVARNVAEGVLAFSNGGGIEQDFDEPGLDGTTTNALLLAENDGGNCLGDFVIAANRSMTDDETCDFTAGQDNFLELDVGLGELVPNGGPTDVLPLLAGSPALNRAGGAGCATDQRGMTGPQAGTCDIGAYEARFQFQVTTTADDDAECTTDPEGCSLREAVTFAAPGAEIELPAGSYPLVHGGLVAQHGLTVEGAGALQTTITPSASRAFAFLRGESAVNGISISGGVAADPEAPGGMAGGAIWVDVNAYLNLRRSHIAANSARNGGGIAVRGILDARHTTIAANVASGPAPNGLGGGVWVIAGQATLINSTVSGNHALEGGGISSIASTLDLEHVTLADNTANIAGSLWHSGGDSFLVNTLFADGSCGGDAQMPVALGLMTEAASCPGEDVPDAGLGPLQDNGGETPDHDLLPGSPAIDAGDQSSCQPFDQRDLARQTDACDIGAVEAGAGALTQLQVTTRVDNSGGGTARDHEFMIHVRLGGTDVSGSPQPGNDHGTQYTLDPGTYTVAGVPENGYTMSFSGDCAADGTVELELNDRLDCTVTFEDPGLYVNTVADGFDGACTADPEGCTLREAVASPPEDAPIVVPPGDYELGGELVIGQDVELVGAGPEQTIITAPTSTPFRLNEGDIFIRGVTVTGAQTGGMLVRPDANLTLIEASLEGNEGGGITVEGDALLERVTVSGNDGGGVRVAEDGVAGLYNTTVSGNDIRVEGQLDLGHVTIAGAVDNPGTVTAKGTIFAGACTAPVAATYSLATGTSCFAAAGSNLVADPQLGPLEPNVQQTATHYPAETGPAVDAAGTTCPDNDQRLGIRPFGVACDIGSVETSGRTKALLRVAVNVVNDSGGAQTSFPVVARRGTTDIGGAGAHVVDPGSFVVSASTPAGYTATFGDGCAADGSIQLAAGDDRRCAVTFDDNAPQGGGGGNQPPPPDDPVAGESVNAEPSGTVKVKLPGSNRFVDLSEPQQLPVGTVVDTLKGRVTLIAAGGQQATFYAGIFKIGQGRGAKPLTTLTLVEKLSCPRGRGAVAAAGKKKRRLWGDGKGKFRTKGKHSAATVVGTKWLVEDRCTSTLTKVAKGRVKVRDFAKRKTVTVRAGKQYVARAR